MAVGRAAVGRVAVGRVAVGRVAVGEKGAGSTGSSASWISRLVPTGCGGGNGVPPEVPGAAGAVMSKRVFRWQCLRRSKCTTRWRLPRVLPRML